MTLQNDLHSHQAHAGATLSLPSLITPYCRLWHMLLRNFFAKFEDGRIEIALPSGGHLVYGNGGTHDPRVFITVHSHRALWRIMNRGMLGLSEGYMEADWSCEDLTSLFDLCLKNRSTFEAIRSRGLIAGWIARLKHLSRANSLKGSRRNISYHYDLGNDFYALWLDPSMTYSSAYKIKDGEDLEVAQWRKFDRALELSGANSGQHILEIGCGWGAFAERATKAGFDVDGLTLSSEQLDYSNERAVDELFADKARFHLRDYRKETGQYDAIVSIEMIEAVGEENWPTYFRCLHDRLRPGGRAVLQAITIAEDQYDRYRKGADFIQTYIFPGGMLPTIGLVKERAEEAGLVAVHSETFGQDYAETLARWRKDFLANWPSIAALGYDERFRRMWLFYLAYCEAGFANGTINVGLYSFERPA